MIRFLRRINLVSACLVIGSFLFSVAVAEAFMRWHMFGSDAWSYSKMKSLRHIGQSGLIQASKHQDILWELKPSLNMLYKLKPFQTNSEGLRDKEYDKIKPSGTFRVAVIGDSYTMGEGIAIEDAYHTVLEERFNAESSGQNFEFINFGVAGYSLPQYLSTIRHKALEYKPDLIFIGFCAANDSKKPNVEAFNHPYVVKPVSNGFFQLFFFEDIGNLYKDIRYYFIGRKPGYNADEAYFSAELKKISELTAAQHVPVALAYIDNKAASMDFEMVKRAAENNGFMFIDGTRGFEAKVSKDHIIYKTDTHPNGTANRKMAEILYPELQKVITRVRTQN